MFDPSIHPTIHFGTDAVQALCELYPGRQFHWVRIPEINDEALKKVRLALSGRLASEMIYSQGMPDLRRVQAMHDGFWHDKDPQNSVLLGLGGGSLMDLVKVLRFVPSQGGWLQQHLDVAIEVAIEDSDGSKVPLVLMPTTAGTGSEVTPTATIWDFEKQKKHSFFGPEVLANVAVVDPSFCCSAPWLVSRDSAIDALSHALEAIWNRHQTVQTTLWAVEAAQIICHELPLLEGDLDNLDRRERLSEAALLAGLAMAKTQTALAHALSYAETAANLKSHGQSCAYWLPFVWQLLIDSACDAVIKENVRKAVGDCFSGPESMRDWLLKMKFSVHPLKGSDSPVSQQIEALKMTPRGQNFAGFEV